MFQYPIANDRKYCLAGVTIYKTLCNNATNSTELSHLIQH